MRRLDLAAAHQLPARVEELLVDVVADGFTVYRCGPKDAPRALVACYQWAHHVDLLTVGDFARVVTARVPTAACRWTSSPPKSWYGPMRAHHSTPCGPCWSWCTLTIPTPLPPLTRRRRACVFPVLSNAR